MAEPVRTSTTANKWGLGIGLAALAGSSLLAAWSFLARDAKPIDAVTKLTAPIAKPAESVEPARPSIPYRQVEVGTLDREMIPTGPIQ